MSDSAVILPLCAHEVNSLNMSLTALRTCAASTTAKILVICNNSEGEFLEAIKSNCDALGAAFHYWEGPFNISKIYNLGTQMTQGKYIAYGSADVVYYPNWLENIIALWERNPKYYCLCGWSFDHRPIPCTQQLVKYQNIIAPTHNPSSGVLVFKRESNFQWDENFMLWEVDCDIYIMLERTGRKAGIAMNARCDHLCGGMRGTPNFDYNKSFGITNAEEQFYKDPRRYLEKKWGLAKQYD